MAWERHVTKSQAIASSDRVVSYQRPIQTQACNELRM